MEQSKEIDVHLGMKTENPAPNKEESRAHMRGRSGETHEDKEVNGKSESRYKRTWRQRKTEEDIINQEKLRNEMSTKNKIQEIQRN